MRLRPWLLVALVAPLAGRIVVACGGNDEEAATLDLGEAGVDGSLGSGDGDTQGAPDATADAGPPSFCRGISFYVAYDDSIEATVGRGPIQSSTGIAFVAGAFANALTADAQGTNVFYSTYDGGDAGDAAVAQPGVPNPIALPSEGTVAFWFKRSGDAEFESFVRPMGPGTNSSRTFPTVGRDGDRIGLFVDLGTGPLLTVSLAGLAPFVRPNSFDHYASVWRKADTDAGRAPLLRLAVNGGLGEVFDAGYDAAGLPPEATDDAGSFSLPYRAERRTPWTTNPTAVFDALRIGGLAATTPRGAIDDLAIWERALSFEEIAAVYESGRSIGESCGLR